jgi:hypothetical protein
MTALAVLRQARGAAYARLEPAARSRERPHEAGQELRYQQELREQQALRHQSFAIKTRRGR